MSPFANPAAPVDAPTALVLFSSHYWPRATAQRRYMKSARLDLLLLALVLLLACVEPLGGLAQQKAASSGDQAAPPKGTYAYFTVQPYSPFVPTNRVPLFTLCLETNGTYLAKYTQERVPTQDGDLVRLLPRTNTAQGTWRWDAQTREFQLEPGDFIFYIKRLPVDKADPNRLVWGRGFLERQESK